MGVSECETTAAGVPKEKEKAAVEERRRIYLY